VSRTRTPPHPTLSPKGERRCHWLGAGVLTLAAAIVALSAAACGRTQAAGKTAVIVLGFDGMDYDLTKQMLAEGRLPNLSKLAAQGTFQSLGTSMPPQSPVAWSNFITGLDAGGHGIFDFVHRDPNTMIPFLSTSRTEASDKTLKLGKYQIPLAADKVELLRHGQPFWEALGKRGIHTTVVRMPANYPPSGSATRELSGMGTPDIVGSYGIFSYFTTDPFTWAGRDISGGKVYNVGVEDGVVHGTLYGPTNPFLVETTKISAPFTVYVDPDAPVAKIVVGGEERVLKVGEWTDWVPVSLDLIPTQSVRVIARFYLRALRDTTEPGPHETSDADLEPRVLRGGAGEGHRPLLHAGNARGHQGVQGARVHGAGVRRAGAHGGRRGDPAVRIRA
jgi:hypothetical protein